MRVRPAIPSDYETFIRLFRELPLPDPIPDESKFDREMLAATLVVERDDKPVGFAHYHVAKPTGFLRILVRDPSVRRIGVGKMLMSAVHEKLVEAGCTEWRLNVLPRNTAAQQLYTSFGFSPLFNSRAVVFPWRFLDRSPPPSLRSQAKPIEPEDDANVERDASSQFLPGVLKDAREKTNRILKMVHYGDGVLGAAIFDPTFPGAYPFFARSAEHALSLLYALHPHKRPSDHALRIVVADQPEVADGLIARGATLLLDTTHMRRAL